MLIAGDIPQAEIDQPDAEQAERAEQGRVGMIQGEEGAVLVGVHQGRVERAAAEHAGADEVPEGGADDVGVGEPVFECPVGLDQAVMLDGLVC